VKRGNQKVTSQGKRIFVLYKAKTRQDIATPSQDKTRLFVLYKTQQRQDKGKAKQDKPQDNTRQDTTSPFSESGKSFFSLL
jgi:hypothetical protein